jgi:hypothetical protein
MSLLARRATLCAILVVAALFRFWQIDRTPPGFHFDEAFEGLEAWRILTDSTYRPLFLSGNFGVAPLNAYANALMFGLFRLLGEEVGPTAMRVTAACLGVLGVLAVYALGAELAGALRARGNPLGAKAPSGRVSQLPYGHDMSCPYLLGSQTSEFSPMFPLLAAATLAVMRWHVHFSRMGIEPIWAPLLWAASMWLLLHGWRTGQWASFAGCGLLLAASMYAYQGAWVIPFLVGLAGLRLLANPHPPWQLAVGSWRLAVGGWQLAIGGWRLAGSHRPPATSHQPPATSHRPPATGHQPPATSHQPDGVRLRGLLLTAVVAVVLVAPLGRYFWQHPDILVLRPGQVAAGGDQDGATNAWRASWATLKMFIPFGEGPQGPGDSDPRRNLPGAPALNLWLAIPFFLGLGLALWRIQSTAPAILLIGLVGLLSPGMFSAEAPHYHRILGAAAPTALLCGVGLDWLWRRPSLRWLVAGGWWRGGGGVWTPPTTPPRREGMCGAGPVCSCCAVGRLSQRATISGVGRPSPIYTMHSMSDCGMWGGAWLLCLATCRST